MLPQPRRVVTQPRGMVIPPRRTLSQARRIDPQTRRVFTELPLMGVDGSREVAERVVAILDRPLKLLPELGFHSEI